MKWEGNRESDNVEDARGSGGGGGIGFGGGRGIGLGTVAIALVAGWIFGINPLTVLSLLGGGGGPVATQQAPAAHPPADDKQARFVATAEQARIPPPAARARPRWGRSIAPATRRSTSTWPSTT
jgi:predicted metalloprotease